VWNRRGMPAGFLVGNSEEEGALERPRLRWENINIYLKNI
jgi:hypothetical protein